MSCSLLYRGFDRFMGPWHGQMLTKEEEEKRQDLLVHLLRFYFERKIGLKRPMVPSLRHTQRRSTPIFPVK